jgi:Uncharacterised protein family (UPF0236)
MTLIEKISVEVAEFQRQIRQEKICEQPLGEREAAAKQLGQRVAQMTLEWLLTEGGTGYEGSYLACACGQRLKYQRDGARTVRSLVGLVRYRRAYYYCGECGRSRCPLDQSLGQSEREISAGVERQLVNLSAHLSFATAAEVLEEVAGVEISGRQVETVAEAVGAQAETKTQAETEAQPDLRPGSKLGLVESAKTDTWIVEMDGVMAPLQDGSWQEIKCGIVYRLDRRVQISAHRWELLQRERCAWRGSVGEFRTRLWATLVRAGARLGDRIVVIADGAEWIDQTVAELFVGARRILDFYHVAERIWQLAHLRYGESSRPAKQWAEAKLEALKAGQLASVCRAIRRLRFTEPEAELTRQETLRYFARHRAAMAYDQYRAADLPIGSGAIEGSCKHLVAARCKQSGMRWGETGLDAIIALRCWVLNQRLDELCPKPKVKIEWAKAA